MDKGIRITSAFEMLGQYLSVVFKISGFGADSLDSDELAIWYGLNTLSGVRRRVVQIIMGIGRFAIHLSVEIPIIIYVYPGVQKWDTLCRVLTFKLDSFGFVASIEMFQNFSSSSSPWCQSRKISSFYFIIIYL